MKTKFENINKSSSFITKGWVNYWKQLKRGKADIILSHPDTNDLMNNANKVNKITMVKTEGMDRKEKLKLDFSRVIERTGRDLQRETEEVNVKLRDYCLGKSAIFVDNTYIRENCINNSKFHLNRKELLHLQKNANRFLQGLIKNLLDIQLQPEPPSLRTSLSKK